MKTKGNRRCHVSFFRLDCREWLDYLSVIYFIFRIGHGVGAGVRIDQELEWQQPYWPEEELEW